MLYNYTLCNLDLFFIYCSSLLECYVSSLESYLFVLLLMRFV